MDKASAESFIFANCLWLTFSPDLRPLHATGVPLQKACSNRYVLLEGVVNSAAHGHMSMYAASIEHVDRLLGYPLLVDIGKRYHGCSFEHRAQLDVQLDRRTNRGETHQPRPAAG
jgi:hypothetical protein